MIDAEKLMIFIIIITFLSILSFIEIFFLNVITFNFIHFI